MTPKAYDFGPFTLVPEQRLLTRDGQPVALTARPFDLLVALVELRHGVAEKGELLARLWPDRSVDEANLSQQVFTVRKALGGDSAGQSYVATVPRRGYRFVAPVVERTEAEPRSAPSARVAADPPAQHASGRSLALLAVAVALALLGLAAWRWNAARRDGPQALRSLAVLPLANLSGDPQEDYLADGFTEALITDLAGAPGLRVISHTSAMAHKGTREPLPAVAQALGVEWLVEGSVQRADGRLRISVRIVDATVDRQLWSQRYDRSAQDPLGVQDEIAGDVARALGSALALGAMAQQRPAAAGLSAQELYLRAREHWNRRLPAEVARAITLLSEAVRLEPRFARAQAALADCHLAMTNYGIGSPRESYERAQAAAERALELERGLPAARSALAYVRLHKDFAWEPAGRELQLVVAASPSDATTRQRWAEWLCARGRHDEAARQMDDVRRIDPLAAPAQANAGRLLFLAHRYPEALAQLERARQLAPRFVWTDGLLALAHARAGHPDEALAAARRAEVFDESSSVPMAHALVAAGREQEAREVLAVLEARARNGTHMAYHLAGVRAVLGDAPQALDWLEQAVQDRETLAILLTVDPSFDSLRSDARYAALVRSIGLDSR